MNRAILVSNCKWKELANRTLVWCIVSRSLWKKRLVGWPTSPISTYDQLSLISRELQMPLELWAWPDTGCYFSCLPSVTFRITSVTSLARQWSIYLKQEQQQLSLRQSGNSLSIQSYNVSLLPGGYMLYFLPFSQAFREQVIDIIYSVFSLKLLPLLSLYALVKCSSPSFL